jgi:murein DD-endopeptidase MepM/ murein hydrolase activator NlpD
MNKNLFFIKRLFIFLGLGFAYVIAKSFKKIFSRKTLLFVSKSGIRSYSVGFAGQMAAAYFVFWLGNLFYQSLAYDSIIRDKSHEISNLEEANGRFKKEVYLLNESLVKINEYFTSTAGYSNVSVKDGSDAEVEDVSKKKFRDIFGNLELSKDDKKTAEKIAESNAMLGNIKKVAKARIEDLEKKISISGLTLSSNKVALNSNYKSSDDDFQVAEISLNGSRELTSRQGGPLHDIKSGIISKSKKFMSFNGVDIRDEISYLSDLEQFIYHAPFSKPMKNYYVSSGFGGRSDPFTRGRANHGGMDFVGREGELVLSPSAGKVAFVGKLGAYGNAVVIDHGYGITTRYGHLSKIKAREGQLVRKGDAIAVQGSTGRSTGPHLHYEILFLDL